MFTPYSLGEAVVVDVDVADLLRLRFAELDAVGEDCSDEDNDLEDADEAGDSSFCEVCVCHTLTRCIG